MAVFLAQSIPAAAEATVTLDVATLSACFLALLLAFTAYYDRKNKKNSGDYKPCRECLEPMTKEISSAVIRLAAAAERSERDTAAAAAYLKASASAQSESTKRIESLLIGHLTRGE
jgi:hypothetical protein